jgi:hypothetical protein
VGYRTGRVGASTPLPCAWYLVSTVIVFHFCVHVRLFLASELVAKGDLCMDDEEDAEGYVQKKLPGKVEP